MISIRCYKRGLQIRSLCRMSKLFSKLIEMRIDLNDEKMYELITQRFCTPHLTLPYDKVIMAFCLLCTGYTPLHYVCFTDTPHRERRPDVATFFIALGANPNIRSRCGEDLIQHELRQNNPISDVLEAIIDVTPNLLPVNNRMAFCLPGACSNGAVSRLVEHYNSIASQPRSLQHLARCAVRRAMGPKRIRKVPYLPLPKIIRDYLLLNNRLITIPHTSQ